MNKKLSLFYRTFQQTTQRVYLPDVECACHPKKIVMAAMLKNQVYLILILHNKFTQLNKIFFEYIILPGGCNCSTEAGN